ncbi:MAG: ABC transporter substrate-binding protein [Christensenellaceae bacterium]|jgi:iron complex transport system substrate-binding protein|nr:ABC transporter substrate-binding protein [Christensenellaceae bacterium]
MKNRITLRALGALLLALLLLSACAQGAPGAQATVTDMMGREVARGALPQKIVSLTPANTEILCALGLEERLIAVDDFSDFPSSVTGLERIGAFSEPNIERITALKPDLILAGDKLQQDAIERLAQLGLKVAATEVSSIDAIPDSILLVGQLTGAEGEAKALADSFTARVAALRERYKNLGEGERPSAYWALSYGEFGDYTAGAGAFPTEMIEIAGGLSVSREMPVPWPMYSLEQLALDDPDFVFLPIDPALAADFSDLEPYASLRAVKEGRVVFIDPNAASRPGPRLADALEAIAAALHPEA